MRIAMRRGDIKYVRFLVNDPNGTATDIDFTEIYFTVKKKSSDRLFCFQKRLSDGGIEKLDISDYQIKIEPKDTAKLVAPKEYVFDIQLDYKNLVKETFVGDFVLKDEVTYPENERGNAE